MATFVPPALPAGHWAAPAGLPAGNPLLALAGVPILYREFVTMSSRNVFLYDGIPDVDKVNKWGAAHAAHHASLERTNATLGTGLFCSYNYLALQVTPTLPHRLHDWMLDLLNALVAMGAPPAVNPALPITAANPAIPLIDWFLGHFYLSEFPKNLTAGYRLTISSLSLRDSLEDYICAFQRILQHEIIAVRINGDVMERASTLAERTQWFREGIARKPRVGPFILAAIQQVILHHATINGTHATIEALYAAARSALATSGIADGASTGETPALGYQP